MFHMNISKQHYFGHAIGKVPHAPDVGCTDVTKLMYWFPIIVISCVTNLWNVGLLLRLTNDGHVMSCACGPRNTENPECITVPVLHFATCWMNVPNSSCVKVD